MSTEENFLDSKCPGCSETVSFPAARANLLEECPFCMMPLIVAAKSGAATRALPFPLSTPRLQLKRLEPEDHNDLVELFVNDEPDLNEIEKAEKLSEEESRVAAWLERDRGVQITTPNESFYLAIVLAEEKKVVGYLSLRLADSNRVQAEIGVHINISYERKGIASEAVAALLDFFFREISLHRVTAHCDPDNAASLRMLEKVGMRKEGVFLEDRTDGTRWLSTAYHALLHREYIASLPEAQR